MNPWIHKIIGFRPEESLTLESLFTQSNGYLGVRGYPEEGGSAESEPMQFVAGYFDHSPVTGNTMVNIPTIRRLRLSLAGEPLAGGRMSALERTLDMCCAVSRRAFTWTSPLGRETRLQFCSFLSYPQKHIHLTEITIRPLNWSGDASIEDVFDGTGLTIGRSHFEFTGCGELKEGHYCQIQTHTSRLGAAIASSWAVQPSTCRLRWQPAEFRDGVASRRLDFAVRRGGTTRLHRFAAVTTDFDRDDRGRPVAARALACLRKAKAAGWHSLLDAQKEAWAALWDDADVRITGDPEREFKLRFSIFQMLQAYRPGDPRLGIGAKFLSGDHYSGHHFWDTDNFLSPFYLFTMPAAAGDLVGFRVRNLPGALAKARALKFRGAFYPWEACPLDGRENCPEWWQDKAAKEPVHIPCGKIELHVNASVAFAADNYLNIAGRPKPARRDIHRMIIGIARFWASRGEWEGNGFSIKNVIGPDEYHEYVDDNAYTNHTARWCLRRAAALAADPELGISPREAAAWRRIADAMVTGFRNGIIAQDRTFPDLPELDRSRLKPGIPLFRQMPIEEIGRHQIVKQADVLALFHLLPFDYDFALMNRCWDYYEPRTVHDSNLSAGSHAVVAALLRRRGDFVRYYDKVLNLDIGGESYNVTEGLHAANAGNAWSATVVGAGGLRWTEDALCLSPLLPEGWRSLDFRITYRRRLLHFQISRRSVEITCGAGRPVNLVVAGRAILIDAKAQSRRLSLDPVAVVFDLDGVLVDSAVCHYRAWKVVADNLRIPFDEKKNDLLRGVSRRESLMILLGENHRLSEAKIADIMARKNQIYREMVEHAGEELLLPGVKPLLSRLRTAGVLLAVASSSKNTPALLRQSGLDRFYFDAIADGNDIRRSKPDPEVFRLAARRLGLPPSRCLCVEDAPAGIESGRRAGMKTLGIGSAVLRDASWHRPSIAETTPEDIFHFLAELPLGANTKSR